MNKKVKRHTYEYVNRRTIVQSRAVSECVYVHTELQYINEISTGGTTVKYVFDKTIVNDRNAEN